MPPDFLVVGHIVKDIYPGSWRLGGAAAYATVCAQRLGLTAAAVTACAPDLSPAEAIPQIQWHVVASISTTTFENRTVGGKREQQVLDLGTPIGPGHLPGAWLDAPIVLLAPVLGDVDPDMGRLFPESSLVGLGAQGWLRRLESGRVFPGRVDPEDEWLVGDVVFASVEDLEDPDEAAAWQARVPIVVLTRGAGGCTVWSGSGRHDIPAFGAREVDATGAGDVFAAAFLVRLRETGDALDAARFASAAASLLVQGVGIDSVPMREQVEALLAGRQVNA
jgi:1D-myo-inositol 3-kinase